MSPGGKYQQCTGVPCLFYLPTQNWPARNKSLSLRAWHIYQNPPEYLYQHSLLLHSDGADFRLSKSISLEQYNQLTGFQIFGVAQSSEVQVLDTGYKHIKKKKIQKIKVFNASCKKIFETITLWLSPLFYNGEISHYETLLRKNGIWVPEHPWHVSPDADLGQWWRRINISQTQRLNSWKAMLIPSNLCSWALDHARPQQVRSKQRASGETVLNHCWNEEFIVGGTLGILMAFSKCFGGLKSQRLWTK